MTAAAEPKMGEVIVDLLIDCTLQKLTPRPESPLLPMLKLK
jgi:hypothetical protein